MAAVVARAFLDLSAALVHIHWVVWVSLGSSLARVSGLVTQKWPHCWLSQAVLTPRSAETGREPSIPFQAVWHRAHGITVHSAPRGWGSQGRCQAGSTAECVGSSKPTLGWQRTLLMGKQDMHLIYKVRKVLCACTRTRTRAHARVCVCRCT